MLRLSDYRVESVEEGYYALVGAVIKVGLHQPEYPRKQAGRGESRFLWTNPHPDWARSRCGREWLGMVGLEPDVVYHRAGGEESYQPIGGCVCYRYAGRRRKERSDAS